MKIGSTVIRKAPKGDYTNGRRGTVIEINEKAQRVRVFWTHSASGKELSPQIRTWVKFTAITE